MANRHKSDIYSIWKYSREINNLKVHGHSRGSERSGFYIPELKLCLDSGIQMYFEPNHIFITHCHADHSFALPMILTGISTKPDVYVPKQHVHLFNKFTNACYQLSKGSHNAKPKTHTTIGVSPGDTFPIKNNYYVKVYDLDHNVETRGYGIVRVKKKLKSEYIGVTGKELIMIKKQGIEITRDVHEGVLVYITDTTIKPLHYNDELFSYSHLLIECTFLTSQDDSYFIDNDKHHKHINWDELLPYVKKYPGITFHLIHFSSRYDDEEIEDFFKKECKNNDLSNVLPWLN